MYEIIHTISGPIKFAVNAWYITLNLVVTIKNIHAICVQSDY